MNTPKKDIFAQFSRHVNSAKADFFLENGIDFVMGRREGPFVWDIDGQTRLINCHSNGGVFNLGHRHPEVIRSLKAALDDVDIGNHHFISEQRAKLAATLSALTPGKLNRVIFGVSGGEAVDAAIKVARKATGRRHIISALGGYHGHTGLAMAAGDAKYSTPFLSDDRCFVQVPFNDLHALEAAITSETAAIIMETVPATLGMPLPSDDYFQRIKQLCDQHACLLIMDEVQTGLGRSGKFWGFEHYDVEPDIVVTAKGLSGGIYPITATLIRDDLDKVFHDDPFSHISTFGGSELGCIVAQKVLEISSQEEFLAHVNRLSVVFSEGLAELKNKFPFLFVEIRQLGLMIGLKTGHPDLGKLMMASCFKSGLLCVFAANDSSVLQFLPPLNIELELATEILQRLEKACELAQSVLKEKMLKQKNMGA